MSNLTIGQIIGLRNGLDPLMSQLQALLSLAYSQTLPLIGQQLATAATAGQAELKKFKAFEDKVSSALDTLNDPAGYAAQQLNDAINTAVTQAGFAGIVTVTVGADGTLSLGVHDTASATYQQALGSNFGIPNLSLVASGAATAIIGYSVNFDVTVNTSGAFAVADPSKPALSVTLDVTAPTLAADVTLSSLRFSATDNGSALHGAFSIDGSGKATFSGSANLGLHLKSDLGSGAFPTLSADLAGSFSFTNAAIDPAHPATFGDKPTIGFSKVQLDIGSFFHDFLKPALDAVKPILAPLHTVVAVLNTDLTFLKGILGPAWHVLDTAGAVDSSGKDIGDGRVTLLDLIKDGAAIQHSDISVGRAQIFINDLDVVLQAIAFLDNVTLGPSSYNLGSFTISDDVRAADFAAANATLAKLGSGQTVQGLLGGLGGPYAAAAGNGYTGSVADALLTILSNKIFSFPILDPTNIFSLMLGRTADLFNFNPTPFTLGTGTVKLLDQPVFPLIDIVLDGALSATAGISFGVDTKGILDYAAGGYTDPGKLLDGLYVTNPVVNGGAAPVLQIAGRIGIGVGLGVPGLEVVGTGGIGGEVDFSLANIGKNYLGPLISQLTSDPLSAFNAAGKITAGFEVGAKILGLPSYSYDSPTVTLLTFNHAITPLVGVQTATFSRIAVTSINGNTTNTTGREVSNDVIRFTMYFSKGVSIIPNNAPVMTLNDGGTATYNDALSKNTGTLVFDYTVLPSDTSIKTLGVASISSQVRDTDGQVVGFADAAGYQFQNVSVDTAQPLNFTAPTGLFNDKTNFNRAFVSVSFNGQDLTLYGNAIVNGGSVATFQQDTGDVNTLTVQQGGTLAMTRGVLRVNGLLDGSTNAGTILIGPAELRFKLNLKNSGVITLGAVGGTPTLSFLNGQTQLTGGGTIALSDSTGNLIGGGPTTGDASALPVLTNVDNTISGAGTIGGYAADGSTGLDLVNMATISGTGTNKLVLLATTTNQGTLSGAGSGGLSIQGTVDNKAGTIAASNGGVVTLGDKADVTGGTLSTPGGADTARILTAGLAAIHGTVKQNAFVQVGAGATLQVTGEIDQPRYVAPTANSARLSAGGGTLQFIAAHVYDGYITGPGVTVTGSTGWTGSVAQTGASGPGLLSDATVAVASTGVLAFSGVTANRGVVAAQGIVAVSGTFDNTGGTLAATGTGHISLSAATVIGGTLSGATAAVGNVVVDGTASTLNSFGTLTASHQAGVATDGLTLKGAINQYSGPALAGTIVADNEDIVLLGATLQNGTLATLGSGRFVVSADSVLDGTSHGLTLPGALTIQFGQSLTIRGQIVNAGSISLSGSYTNAPAVLKVTGTSSLTGGGTVRLQDIYYADTRSDVAVIKGLSSAADTLDNVDNVIVGYGELGSGRLSITNEAAGIINAEGSTLLVATGAGAMTNRGLIEATKGGRLLLETSIDNTSGRVLAATGSTVQLGGNGIAGVLAGGRVETAGTGAVLVIADGGGTLDGRSQKLTNAGTVALATTATLTLKGAIANTGSIAANGSYTSALTAVRIAGAVTLSGGGGIALVDTYYAATHSDVAAINGTSASDRLENVDNLISGYGELGSGALTLVNDAAGVVDATVGTLILDTGTVTVKNAGLLEATAGGTLDVRSAVASTGQVLADATGTVILKALVSGGTVLVAKGGTLAFTGGALASAAVTTQSGALIAVTSTGTIDGTASTISLAGTLTVAPTATLTLKGAIANSGSFALNGSYTSAPATMRIAGAVTLSGGGGIALVDTYYAATHSDVAAINGTSASDRLENVDNLISGYGELGSGALTLVNDAAGVVDATVGTLILDTGTVTVKNAGLLEATAGGTLDVRSAVASTGQVLADATGTVILKALVSGGTVLVAKGGTLAFTGGALASAAVTTQSGALIAVTSTGTIDGTASTISLAGTLTVAPTATLTLKGAIANSGSFALNGSYTSAPATMRIAGAVTLSGGGGIALVDTYYAATHSDVAAINGTSASDRLENVDNLISGYGELGSGALTLVNDAAGVVDATVGTLILDTGTVTVKNAGLLEATAGGTLDVRSAVASTGQVLADATGTVILKALVSGGTVLVAKGGTLAFTGGALASAAVTTQSGALIAVTSTGTIDGTASTISLAGTLTVAPTATLTLKGAIANSGSFALNGSYTSAPATMRIAGAVTLSGGGGIALVDTYYAATHSDVAAINGTSASDRLENVDNLISGYGELGSGALTLVNDAAGVVDATVGTLILDTGIVTVKNAGLLEATAGGTLDVRSAVASTGQVLADATGTVILKALVSGGTVLVAKGGTLAFTGGALASAAVTTQSGALIAVTSTGTIDGTASTISLAGTLTVAPTATLTLKGAIANSGSFALNGSYTSAPATMRIAGAVTLSGGGGIALVDTYYAATHSDVAAINGTSASDRLENVDNLISGYGELGSGALTLVNDAAGVVDATVGTLILDAGETTAVNAGLLEATAAGTLDVRSAVTDNGTILASKGTVILRRAIGGTGTVQAADGGTLTLLGGALAGSVGVSSTAHGAITVSNSGSLDGTTRAVTLAGTLDIGVGTTLAISGSIANSGTISLDGSYTSAAAVVKVIGTATLTGHGTVRLLDTYTAGTNSDVAAITGATTADALDNVDNNITGYGELGQGKLSFTNEAAGTVSATAATLNLNFGATTTINRGTFLAAGGTLAIGSKVSNLGAVRATAGTAAFAAGAVANLVSGVLTGGAWSTNGGTITLADAVTSVAATLIEDGATGGIAAAGASLDSSLASITAAGALQLLGGRNWAGTNLLANAGEIRLAGGRFASGVLTNTGRIDGSGTIASSVVNTGTIEATGGALTLVAKAGGSLQIDAGATLVLQGGAGPGTTVSFAGVGGTLSIAPAAGASSFDLTLGLGIGNTVDLAGVLASATSKPGSITLSAGGQVLGIIRMAAGNAYTADATSDGHGGTLIATRLTDPLFDPVYYLAQNPDVAAAGADPYSHYMNQGWKEGRNPSALFNTHYYLAQNPDVAVSGANPLTQFETVGWTQGRDPSIGFSVAKYLAAYPDIKAAGVDPLVHYVNSGKAEGRTAFAATPHAVGPQDPLIDAAYVDAHNPAVAAAGLDPTVWFNTVGWTVGANPDAFFNTTYYLNQNADVKAAGINPLAHFEASGWKEGRDPSALFSDRRYLAAYPDIGAAGINPLQHYLSSGLAEGRMAFAATPHALGPQDPLVDAAYVYAAHPDVAVAGLDAAAWYHGTGWKVGANPDAYFDTSYYLTQNPDVRAAGLDPLAHFEANGWKEGREPSLVFSDARYLAAYPDIKAAGVDPLAHYLASGRLEGRMAFLAGGAMPVPDPLVNAAYFDAQFGATLIPAGAAGAQQAAFLYDAIGWQRGLNPDALFDTNYYLSRNPDIAAAHINPLLHYENNGWKEGRDPSAQFSTNKYLAAYGDVKAAGLDPLLHFVSNGQSEGRSAFTV